MTRRLAQISHRALSSLRKACRVTDEYGRHYTLRFTAFLFAVSFSSTLIVETTSMPPIL